METVQFIFANGGAGEASYANNSSFQVSIVLSNYLFCPHNELHCFSNFISLVQSKMISKVKPILEESMKSLYCNSVPSCFKVADLGCSSGPNALQVAYDVIDAVHNISRSSSITFQIYLNDQFQNDFNNIFHSLPCFYQRLREEKGEGFGACFVNATPGSFYGRLFPTNSMHFFHSSTSLHWLSQVIIIFNC